jgi:hypothetical protein
MGVHDGEATEQRQQTGEVDQHIADRARVPDYLVDHAPVSILIEKQAQSDCEERRANKLCE